MEELDRPERFVAALFAPLLEQSQPRGLIAKIKGLPKGLLDLVSSRIAHVKTHEFEIGLRDLVKDKWEDIARSLILEMEKAEGTVLFIIDEFPQLVENIARDCGDDTARGFLQWFRSLRMKRKDVLRRYRFVLGGSTGIDITLRRLDVADKLNDFFRVPIEAISSDAAEALLDALVKVHGLRLAKPARRTVLSIISPPVPYFLQLLVSQIRMEENLAGREIGQEDVQDVYQRRVLGPTCRAYFDYYRQRLRRYGDHGERAALAILQLIANASIGRVSSSALYGAYRETRGSEASTSEFDEIMADLETDWYVRLDTRTNEYSFLVTLMKDWWNRFHRTVRPGPA